MDYAEYPELLYRLGLLETAEDGEPRFVNPPRCRCGAEIKMTAHFFLGPHDAKVAKLVANQPSAFPFTLEHVGTPCDWLLAELAKP